MRAARAREHLASLAKRARRAGVRGVLRDGPAHAYEHVWPYLPRGGHVEKNGVEIARRSAVTDRFLPALLTRRVPGDDPGYEALLLAAVRDTVGEGDAVVIVGGGEGVSTVVAADRVGPDSHVTVYEGGAEQADRVRRTVAHNGVADRVAVRHAVVGEAKSLRSSPTGADVVAPSDLPECDVVVVDADGAEVTVVEGLAADPATLVVEHHRVPGDDGVAFRHQPGRVRAAVADAGYDVVEEYYHPTRAYGRYPEHVFVGRREE